MDTRDIYMGPAGPVNAWRVPTDPLNPNKMHWPAWLSHRYWPTFPFKPDTFRLGNYGEIIAQPGHPMVDSDIFVPAGDWLLLDPAGHFGRMSNDMFQITYKRLTPVGEDERTSQVAWALKNKAALGAIAADQPFHAAANAVKEEEPAVEPVMFNFSVALAGLREGLRVARLER